MVRIMRPFKFTTVVDDLQLIGATDVSAPSQALHNSACPSYLAIQGSAAKIKSVTHNLMTEFVSMNVKGFGVVYSLKALFAEFCSESYADKEE